MSKIAVGISGGVDSSVAALLLKEAGHEVVCFFMKNWDDDDPVCPQKEDYEDALLVANKLGLPLYTFNFAKQYQDSVFSDFLTELRSGRTPNPDILCNREIKFKVFLQKALELGCDALATGHYARVGENGELLRGIDSNKDQTYFLYTLKKDLLQKILFPIGKYEKSTIREIAKKNDLITHDKKDSTGICFIGKRNFKEFVSRYIYPTKGTFETPEGEVVGHHEGAWYYTIGQRKGLGIGGPGDAWFVAAKDIEKQIVTVVQGENHPLLYFKGLTIESLSLIDESKPLPSRCTAKIRYRHQDAPCSVLQRASSIEVIFDTPQRAVTEGQSIVFYQNHVCLGGAVIKSTFQTHNKTLLN